MLFNSTKAAWKGLLEAASYIAFIMHCRIFENTEPFSEEEFWDKHVEENIAACLTDLVW